MEGMSESERAGRATIVEVIYSPERGRIGLRGSRAPLSWEETMAPTRSEGNRHIFELAINDRDLVELKLVRNEEDWAGGRNYVLHAGDHLHLEPSFDRSAPALGEVEEIEVDGQPLRYRVLLPPSYEEQETKRYPVVYVQDGQALWTTSEDPYGVWGLDAILGQMFDLGAVEELIVVGIDTSERRMERLSPEADPKHGGGEGGQHLKAIIDHLRPHLNERLRTRPESEHTAVMGSSMGGLFSFFAAWSRPDVFGKAACLSSSFWWADRGAIRAVQDGKAPEPRPTLYLDSGAALDPDDRDPGARDGFHHTRAMHRALATLGYTPGVDLHRLTFPGHTHDASSWAARVAIPIQILFPPARVSQVPQPPTGTDG